jgi:hypothetical protein
LASPADDNPAAERNQRQRDDQAQEVTEVKVPDIECTQEVEKTDEYE